MLMTWLYGEHLLLTLTLSVNWTPLSVQVISSGLFELHNNLISVQLTALDLVMRTAWFTSLCQHHQTTALQCTAKKKVSCVFYTFYTFVSSILACDKIYLRRWCVYFLPFCHLVAKMQTELFLSRAREQLQWPGRDSSTSTLLST